MTTKTSKRRTPTKSDAIRAVLKKHPKAPVKQIRASLDARGIKASTALINKIKYGQGGRATTTKSLRHGGNHSNGNKAQAIRLTWKELGREARPRDVISALASRGVTVSSAQVSTLRKSSFGNGTTSQGSPALAVPFDHLLAAKTLVHRLGGIEAARHALSCLAQLSEL